MQALELLRQLAEPFPEQIVKQSPSGWGTYVSHGDVNQRLLSIVGLHDFNVVEAVRGYAPELVTEKGTYPARENAIVGCRAALTINSGDAYVRVTEVGDVEHPAMNHDGVNLKHAASDAYKRCAMRLGLGLHLWTEGSYFLDKQLDKQLKEQGE